MTSIGKNCERVLKRLLIMALAVVVATCGKGDDTRVSGDAEWRQSSSVSYNEGSVAIQLSGTLGAEWRAEIKDGSSWCSFRINDLGASTKEGRVQSNELSNILDIYYTRNNGADSREAIIEITFAGNAPITLSLTQFTSSSTDDPYSGGHATAWAELPAKRDGSDYIYVCHFAKLSDINRRNFSFCYDKTLHVAHWVAYPLHAVYRGSQGRTDEFGYDPKVETSYQPNLGIGSYKGSYDRGHQLPSADRTANYEFNAQTFYATNMTPQLNRLNQDMWGKLEAKVRANMVSDTLYVVTGCYYANTNTTTTAPGGMICPIPTNYFKVLLRTKSGNTGKRIADCTASELISIGFWTDHKSYGNIDPPASICKSVSDIEKLTGFTFFPNIASSASESVKTQNNPSQWGVK